MDVLSQVLKNISLSGAVFVNGEFSCPWGFCSPRSADMLPYVDAPAAAHIIVYHFVTEGRAWARTHNGPRVELGAGDIVVFPHGEPHQIGNGTPGELVDNGPELGRIFTQGLDLIRGGGGGEVTKMVCGYMTCDPQLSQLVLSGLPSVFSVNIRADAQGEWLESSIRFAISQVASSGAGSEAVLAKLSEALFIETMRRYVANRPPTETGWLVGSRDPQVGQALAALHREPSRRWTIADLAAGVGVSRAVLAERFRHYLGEPPIAYLTRLRLHLGARLLRSSNQSVAEIAEQVGYESEASFNRAFKRDFGAPPAAFRKQGRSAAAHA